MSVRQQCALCGGFLISPKRRGKRFRCAKCRAEFVVEALSDIQSVVDAVDSALDYSGDDGMKETMLRLTRHATEETK